MNTWVLFLGHKKRTFNSKEHTEGDKLGCFLEIPQFKMVLRITCPPKSSDCCTEFSCSKGG